MKIENCPFCGGECRPAEFESITQARTFWVCCKDYRCSYRSPYGLSAAAAIRAMAADAAAMRLVRAMEHDDATVHLIWDGDGWYARAKKSTRQGFEQVETRYTDTPEAALRAAGIGTEEGQG